MIGEEVNKMGLPEGNWRYSKNPLDEERAVIIIFAVLLGFAAIVLMIACL